jgi:hypothetical protein
MKEEIRVGKIPRISCPPTGAGKYFAGGEKSPENECSHADSGKLIAMIRASHTIQIV